MASIRGRYEVASPILSAVANGPVVAGQSPFPINVIVDNKGIVPAAIQVSVEGGALSDTQSITLKAGEAKSIFYNTTITMDTTFTVNLTGDLHQTINLPVRYGEGASVVLNAQAVYPEGRIGVPFTMTNTGQMEGSVEMKFELLKEATVINQQSRGFALSPGASATGTLFFDLGEGDYQITGVSQLPQSSVQASFSVKKENRVDMTISQGTQAEGLIPVAAHLTNLGHNNIEGRIQLSARSGQGTTVWVGHQGVNMPYSQPPAPCIFTLNINPAAIPPGNYTLKGELLNNSGQLLAERSVPFIINGPSFQITQLPPYQTFTLKQEATFTFKVKNMGNQEGAFDFHLKAYDLIDLTRQEWLKAGEEMALDFGFPLPEDLEEKDYFADYELKNAGIQGFEGSRGQVKYRLAGINLKVRASLNKEYYHEGETAHLTLLVSASNAEPPALNFFARVNYPGYESKQAFALDGSQGLSFDIPLTKITGEKLFFGIYHESGRSIHLNSLYIYKAGEVITLMTDKQVYKPGETVGIKMSSAGPDVRGILTLNAPDYEDTFSFAGTAEKSFSLPAVMTAGTYYVGYRLSAAGGESYTGNHPFDVEGIQVKVKEANLDKGKYVPGDMINLRLTIESNRDLSATLKTWVVDPQKNHSSPETQGLTLTSSELSLATQALSLKTTHQGLHRIIYGIYDGDLLLCSGAEVFDVGEAIALGVSTDHTFYPSGREPVIAEASLYGTAPATLNFFLNGEPVASQEVLLSGFTSYRHTIIPENPGLHSLKAVLTSAGLISAQETTFIYGSGLPDLMVWLLSDRNISNVVINFTATVINRGKSHSAPTTLTIYDGQITAEKILATLEVKDLAPGESQTFSFSLNMRGRAGVNDILAWIDPGKTVNEFNRANNQTKITFTAPDLALATILDKDEYSPGDAVIITGLITNLAPNPSVSLSLTTTVRNAADLPLFTNSADILSIDGLATHLIHTTWLTAANLPEGTYTVIQAIQGKDISSNKSITIKAADKDFAIACELANKKIEKGETVQYDLTLTPLRGFVGEVHLSIKDCPAGFTASFTPNPVFLAEKPVQATLKMIPTAQVSSGSYGLRVNAAGGGRSHEIALRLDLTDFNITLTPGIQRIKQLEGATYAIAINPLHGFDSLVTLTVRGVPQGMRASLNPSNLTHSGKATLALTTSKWLPPGSYSLSITADGRNVRHTAIATLVVDKNPLIAPGIVTAPGPHNNPIIKTFRADGVLLNEFQAFEDRADVHIAAGDVDGDGIDELIVGAGKEEGRSLKLVGVFKRDGTPIAFMEADQRGKYEVTVAAGDIDGDWVEEVAVGFYAHNPKEVDAEGEADKPGHRRGYGVVKVYKIIGQKFFDTGLALYPYEKEGYRGAPNIAMADIDGDGQPELITAPGPDPSAPARIKVFKIDTRAGVGRWKIAAQMADLIVPLEWRKEGNRKMEVDWSKPRNLDGYGATLTTGDVDGDGKAEIIVGAGPDPRKSAQVVILYYRDGRYIAESFIAYEESRFGVAIASGDINGDGLAEIIAGPGPDPQSKAVVRIFRRDGTLTGKFQAYPNRVRHGVRVAVGGLGEE
ncbi:MAG: CARDB domain-containing protein [Thermodesulfobacteriota bacterium]|nr:CARDB domain-containing protein [Thermodesulfobacteriota bacterium]